MTKRILLIFACLLVLENLGAASGSINPRVERVRDDLFVAELEPEVYAVMERVTPASIENWYSYVDAQRKSRNFRTQQYADEGLSPFEIQLMEFYSRRSLQAPKFEMWIAYILNSDEFPRYPFASRFDMKHVEMACTVSTREDTPFTVHMGISRAWTYMDNPRNVSHKNISLKLHGFAGKVMKMLHPGKLYMITAPNIKMRRILLEALPRDSVWVGDSEFYKSLERDSDQIRKEFFAVTEKRDEAIVPYAAGEAVMAKHYSPIKVNSRDSDYPLSWSLADLAHKEIFSMHCATPKELKEKANFFSSIVEYARKVKGCYVTVLLDTLADSFDRMTGSAS